MKLLTIGMIVRDEEQNLPICIERLEPLRAAVSSELVITDTGSTDTTPDIAKAHADRFIDYKWADDFAAARNTTLVDCRTEWYMYVDADEHLEDCAPLIEFFISGAYKDYANFDSASVVIKNILNERNEQFLRSVRLFRYINSMKFYGRVHERICAPLPHCFSHCFETDAVFSHRGYFGELSDIKAARNLPLMETELSAAKDDYDRALKLLQIGEAIYKADPERAENYWETGFETAKPLPGNLKYALLVRLEMFRFGRREFAAVKALHERYTALRMSDNYEMYFDLEDAFYSGLSFAALGDVKLSRELLLRYRKLLNIYRSGGMNSSDNSLLPAFHVSQRHADYIEKVLRDIREY
jgi:glycosyltransferase involved in cell wall biosynthesis